MKKYFLFFLLLLPLHIIHAEILYDFPSSDSYENDRTLYLENTDGDETPKNDIVIYPIKDDINLTTRIKNLNSRQLNYQIKTVLPELTADDDNENVINFNQLCQNIADEEIAQFKNKLNESKFIKKSLVKSRRKNSLDIDFDSSVVMLNETPIVSIRFSLQSNLLPFSHPIHKHRVLNYDLSNGNTISFADFVRDEEQFLNLISHYIRERFSTYKNINQKMLNDATEPTAENFKNWNIKPQGFIFTFEAGTILPREEGTQTIMVPLKEISSVIPSGSPLYFCLKHQSHCLRNNVLTGGFMEESLNTLHRAFNKIFS